MYSNELSLGFGSHVIAWGSGTATFNLNNANNMIAFGFSPTQSKTISKLTVYMPSVTGTLGSSDLVATIYVNGATSGGSLVLGSSLGSTSTVTATPTGAAFVEFTGLSVAVTKGTSYLIVFTNVNATPASNFPAVQYFINNSAIAQISGGSVNHGLFVGTSTNAGSTFTNSSVGCIPGVRLQYSDNTYDGFVGSTTYQDSTDTINSTNAVGVKFTTPNNVTLNVSGVSFPMTKTGSPTGNVRAQIYQNTTLLATSISRPASNISSDWMRFQFTSSVQLLPNTSYRVVLSEETNSDTSSNSYRLFFITGQNDANTKALKPINGTATKTFYNGSTWTDTDTDFPWFMVWCDFSAPVNLAHYSTGNAS